jgi:hypothetical protein
VGLLHDIKPVLLMLQHPSNKMTYPQLIMAYNAALRLLPSRRHFDFVLNFFSWLNRLASDSAKTKMGVSNLSVVIGHNLFHGFGDDVTSLEEIPILNKATEFLITHISQMAGRTATLAEYAHRMSESEVDTKFKKLTTFGMARRRSLHMVMNVVQAAGAVGFAAGAAVGRAGRMIRRNSLHAPTSVKDLASDPVNTSDSSSTSSETTAPDGAKRRRRNSVSRRASGVVVAPSSSAPKQLDDVLFAEPPSSRPRRASLGRRRSIGSAQTRRPTSTAVTRDASKSTSTHKGTPKRPIQGRRAITPYNPARGGKRLNLRVAPTGTPTLALRPTVRKAKPLTECNQQFEDQMAFRSKLMRSDPREGESVLALDRHSGSPHETAMYNQRTGCVPPPCPNPSPPSPPSTHSHIMLL